MDNWKWPQKALAIWIALSVVTGFDSDNLCVYATAAEKYLDGIADALILLFLTYAGGFWKGHRP